MEIAVATPPDKIYDDSIKLLLIYPRAEVKNLLSEYLKTVDENITVYMYEPQEHDPDWLMSCIDQSNLVFYDMDNSDPQVRIIDGYILSKSNTYWLTQGNNVFYTMLSRKQLYSYDQLIEKIGGLIVP